MTSEKLPQPGSAGQPGNSGRGLPARPPEDEAFRFLEFLFEGMPGGFVEFRHFTADAKPAVVDTSIYLPLPLAREGVERVLQRRDTRMICFGVAPRFAVPASGAGKDRDCLTVRALWADCDFKGSSVVEVVERIQALPLRPSVVVDSGFGRHVYYVLHQPVDPDSELPEWKRQMVTLRDVLRGDPVQNLSRVLRLPGTLNHKHGSPVPCRVIESLSSGLRYSLEEVAAALDEAGRSLHEAESASQSVSTLAPAASAFNIQELIRRGVRPTVREAIVTGRYTVQTGPNAGRTDDESVRDFAVAMHLLERGFSPEEIKSIFRANPQGVGSKWAVPRHGEKYLDQTVVEAQAKFLKDRAGQHPAQASEDEGVPPPVGDRELPDCYKIGDDGGLWFEPPKDETGKAPRPFKVANSPLRIEEILENVDTGQVSVGVGYDYLGRRRRTTLLRSQMSDARQLVLALAGEGAPVTSTNARAVVNYLAAYEHAFSERLPRKKTTSRFGYGRGSGAFFLPGMTADVEFAPTGAGDSALYRGFSSRRGKLEEWLDGMRQIEQKGCHIPQVAVLTAFVPPLQAKLQIPNFLLDLHGNTTTGKSTSLKLAASVWGQPDDKHPDSLVLQWQATKVALEQLAGQCSDLPLFLDDAQHTADDLKKTVIYMIANGRGKSRGARGGGVRETATWRTVALSTSEEPLHESSPHEGARGRLLPVGGLVPPFPANEGSFVQELEGKALANHGHAGLRFIQHLNGFTQQRWLELQRQYAILRAELLKRSHSDIVGRVAGYIAAIQVAGEVVCPLLQLPFKPDVLAAWLALHLEEQQTQQNLVLAALRVLADHYVANPRLFATVGVPLEGDQRRDLQGAVRQGEYVAFMRSALDQVFSRRRWNTTAILHKLAEAGALMGTEQDRLTKKVSIDGTQTRLVCVKWSSILPDDVEE